MGQTFASGHVLGLRRRTVSSVGEQFASIWHRQPDGRWHFYESARPQFACLRWFGHGVEESVVIPIDVTWDGPTQLHVTADGRVDWCLTLALAEQARLGDFWIPQQGIFAMGGVFVGTPN